MKYMFFLLTLLAVSRVSPSDQQVTLFQKCTQLSDILKQHVSTTAPDKLRLLSDDEDTGPDEEGESAVESDASTHLQLDIPRVGLRTFQQKRKDRSQRIRKSAARALKDMVRSKTTEEHEDDEDVQETKTEQTQQTSALQRAIELAHEIGQRIEYVEQGEERLKAWAERLRKEDATLEKLQKALNDEKEAYQSKFQQEHQQELQLAEKKYTDLRNAARVFGGICFVAGASCGLFAKYLLLVRINTQK